MAVALYFPFSRCLDQVALKQAVLIYDELLFVDPVSPEARAALYAREQHYDDSIKPAWVRAQRSYELLASEQLVRTVGLPSLDDNALVRDNLTVDLELNQGARLFRGRSRMKVLAQRLPSSALADRYDPQLAPQGPGGEDVLSVPYAVGASVALTRAMEIAHDLGATMMTDHELHHVLLLRRLRSAAALPEDALPSMYAATASAPAPSYRRRQLEMRLLDQLAPAEALRHMSMEQVIMYRQRTDGARRELNAWIDQLDAAIRSRPWDHQLDEELQEIVRRAAEIGRSRNRWQLAASAAKSKFSVAGAAGAALIAAPSALTGVVTTGTSLWAALGVVATATLAYAHDSAGGGADGALKELLRKRAPEHNAVAYLLNARAS